LFSFVPGYFNFLKVNFYLITLCYHNHINKENPMLKRLRYLSAILVLAIGLASTSTPAFATPQINEYPVSSGAAPSEIAVGGDGANWFPESQGNKIGRMTVGGALTEYNLPNAESLPYAITAAPDGNLWFTEYFGQRIASITTAGVITELPLPSYIRYPTRITMGGDGNIWFIAYDTTTGGNVQQIFSMTPTGTVTEHVANPGPNTIANFYDIQAGPDGKMWFSESAFSGNCQTTPSILGQITYSGTITYTYLPTGCNNVAGRMILGADGAWWFTQGTDNNSVEHIGRYSLSGNYSQYAVTEGPDPLVGELTNGPDGNIWFTDNGNGWVGNITPTGVVTEYPLPTAYSSPAGLVTGSDGNIWFTEAGSNKIGEVVLAPVATNPIESINAGGSASGNYTADAQFTGGGTYTSTAAVDTSNVDNPAPENVYQSVRYGSSMSYTLSDLTPNASYTLRLHFDEVYFGTASGTGGIGSRVFNVTANGTPELTNFDIYQAAGGANRALVEQIPVTANSSGTISVNFVGITDNAMVSGLELYGGTLPTPTPPATVTTASINAGGNTAGTFSADTDFGGGGQTYSTTAGVDTSGVTDPAPQDVYKTVRYGNFTYTVPNLTPNTNFKVRLHFSEPYFGTVGVSGGVGSRVFNVSANGTTELSNFDVYQAAGGANKAIAEEFTVPSDAYGNISLRFTSVTDNALVNGIEIAPAE
jgi:streptogramin lyase